MPCPVDCEWGSFDEWSSCSKTCGGGEMSRSRSEVVLAIDGGRKCKGEAVETKSCNTNACPVDCQWSNYGDWSSCSTTCGEGLKVRNRFELVSASNGGEKCKGEAVESKLCNKSPCSGNS